MKLSSVFFFGAVATTLGVNAASAWACTPPPCWPSTFSVPNDAVVPANVQTLIYSAPFAASSGQTPSAAGFSLRDSNGGEVPVTVAAVAPGGSQFRVTLASALVPGNTYKVHYPKSCGDEPSLALSFKAGPQSNSPVTIGSARFLGYRLGVAQAPVSTPGICPGTTVPVTAALGKVSIAPTPEMRAYWPLASLRASFDGRGVPLAAQSVLPNGDVEVDLYAACASSPGSDPGLPEGTHSVKIEVSVSGVDEALPSLTVPVTVSCAPVPDGGAPLADAGVLNPDAGAFVPDARVADASLITARDGSTVDAPSQPKSGGGCSAAPQSPTSTAGFLVASAGIAMTLYRRMRARVALREREQRKRA